MGVDQKYASFLKGVMEQKRLAYYCCFKINGLLGFSGKPFFYEKTGCLIEGIS
jgi:hypothetical protein